MRSAVKCLRLGSLAALLAVLLCSSPAGSAETLVHTEAQTSRIDGRSWNTSFPGDTTLDAVHRSVLLRFPGSAGRIAERLSHGFAIERAFVELEYAGHELRPAEYVVRDRLGRPHWEKDPPHWHIVGWALRRPWIASDLHGPTFGAQIRDAVPWTQAGAASETGDRWPQTFGPVELSAHCPVARLDVTGLLDGATAEEPGRRLVDFEANGLLLRKLEKYDAHYHEQGVAYDWAVPTGGHGLTFKNPRLVVQLREGATASPTALVLPEMQGVAALARSVTSSGLATPTTEPALAVETLRERAKALLESKPAWLSEAQFEHVGALLHIGGDANAAWLADLAAGDARAYQRALRTLWLTPPRFWKGWGIHDDIILNAMLGDLLPPHIREHLRDYWASWLMPDIPTGDLLHPQSAEAHEYALHDADWRGRYSFFRDGYTHSVSTQNINHTAVLGALLMGRFLGAPAPMADGRDGLERLLLRYWAFQDGSSQEVLDHYYLSITLSGQKLIADFGPSAFDRLAGRIMLERTMELLATLYHPGLRRLVAPSGRARMSGVLGEQDGIYGALHVVSQAGVLNYLDTDINATAAGLPVWGREVPPGRVALQSLTGPWAPRWFAGIIDDKPLPFSEISAETVRGSFNPPLRRTTYLGRTYGLASQDIKGGAVDVLGQWRRTTGPAQRIEDIGTLTVRNCINACQPPLNRVTVLPRPGAIYTVQVRNRAVIFMRPPTDRAVVESLAGSGGLASLSSVLELWSFSPSAAWRLQVDGRALDLSELPLRLLPRQVLTLKDGPTYVGLRFIAPLDLAGDEGEVTVSRGNPNREVGRGVITVEPALVVAAGAFESQEPRALDAIDWQRAQAAHAAFAVELADEGDYPSLDAFSAHMMATSLEGEDLDQGRRVRVTYRTGRASIGAVFATDVPRAGVHYPLPPGQQTRAISERLADGSPMVFPAALDRDTSWSQQGSSGRLEKNGAVLETQPGRKAYLIVEPSRKGVLAYNPLPDPTAWRLTLPDGARVVADGQVGLLRVALDGAAQEIEIDHAPRDAQQATALARRISLEAFVGAPSVRINGRPIAADWRRDPATGRWAAVVPLEPAPDTPPP